MEAIKKSSAKAEDLVGHIVYTWLGKMRWLPHIGPAYYVVGSRADHVIAVPVNQNKETIGERRWIRITDLSVWCDAYEEFQAVQQLMAEYRTARNAADTKFAQALSRMSKQEAKRLSGVRQRKRPLRPFYVPKTGST